MNNTRDLAFYVLHRCIYTNNLEINITKLNRICYFCYAGALSCGECICTECPVATEHGITFYQFLYNDVYKTNFWEEQVKPLKITQESQNLIDEIIDFFGKNYTSRQLCDYTIASNPWKRATNNGETVPALLSNADIAEWARIWVKNDINLEEKYPELKQKNNLYYKAQIDNINFKKILKVKNYNNDTPLFDGIFTKDGELGWLNPFNWLP